MASQAMQKALARIYLDADLREKIVAHPSVLNDLRLGQADAEQLRAFVLANRRALDRFAEMIGRKRALRLASVFPISSRLLGADTWASVCKTALSTSASRTIDEVTLCAQVMNGLDNWRDLPPFRDLVTLEALKATVARLVAPEQQMFNSSENWRPKLNRSARIARLDFSPTAISAWASAGGVDHLDREPTPVLLHKRSGTYQTVQIATLRPLLAEVLMACDGHRMANEIALDYSRGRDELASGIREALQGYLELGVLSFEQEM